MSGIKKMAAVLMSLVMVVCMFSVSSGAAVNLYTNASTIKSGKTNTATLKTYGAVADYKITSNAAGTLKITLDVDLSYFEFSVYDSDGKKLHTSARNIKSGSMDDTFKTVQGRFKATLSYKVDKGTYYIRIERPNSQYVYVSGYGTTTVTGTGKVSLKASFPSGEIQAITIPMKVGAVMQLGAITSNGDGEIKWESSKSSVASISSNGKVKAKKKGTTVITATLGITKQVIVIKVS